MTSQPSTLGAVAYELEGVPANWAASTDTFANRLEIFGEPVVPSDIQDRIAEPITKQYLNEGKAGILGPWKDSSFTIRGSLHGHGTAPTGALSATDLYDLLLNIVGGGSVDSVGTTVAAGPTSASQFGLVAGTVESGCLVRCGTVGDGRGNGQFVAVDNIATTTLLTAMDATPSENDVIYAAQNIYPLESANAATVASTRWLLQTANGQWKARGCFPKRITISQINVGEAPTWEIEMGVSQWEDGVSETFPTTDTTDAKDGSVCAAGSLFIGDVGTVTRNTYCHRSWTLNINMEVMPLKGICSSNQYQTTVSARRTAFSVDLGVVLDAEAAGTTTWADKFEAGTMQHVLMTLSSVNGKAIGFYFPNAEITSRPTQEAGDNLNRIGIGFRALTGPDKTSEETMACMKLAMG